MKMMMHDDYDSKNNTTNTIKHNHNDNDNNADHDDNHDDPFHRDSSLTTVPHNDHHGGAISNDFHYHHLF